MPYIYMPYIYICHIYAYIYKYVYIYTRIFVLIGFLPSSADSMTKIIHYRSEETRLQTELLVDVVRVTCRARAWWWLFISFPNNIKTLTKCKQLNRSRDMHSTRAKGPMRFKTQRNSKLEHMGRSATKEDRDDLTKRKSRPSRFGQVQEVSWKYGRPILESSLWSSVMLWCLSWPWSCNFAVGRCTFWVVLSTEKGLPETLEAAKKKYNKRFKAKIWCLAGLNKHDAS